jgi:hypothetical protein
MKFQRPGYTETTLIFIDYLRENGINSEKLINSEKNFINWIYSVCGFYDKEVSGSYFDIDTEKVIGSQNYKKFLNEYRKALKESDRLCTLIHEFYVEKEKIPEFQSYLNPKILWKDWYDCKPWYDILENKKVLLVSSFADLMEKQYKCGNMHKIDVNFPKMSLITYKTPYTFFNDGPYNNFFETLDVIKKDISSIDFDVAIIACGPYAVLLADHCHNMGKIGISIGSGMHTMFGIDPNKTDDPLWVSEIPDEYKPNGYEKIEGGRYWKCNNTK